MSHEEIESELVGLVGLSLDELERLSMFKLEAQASSQS